jgi:transposase
MSNFVPFNRGQSFLLPPDLNEWLPADDVAHFVVAAVERVPLAAFNVPERAGGKPQYHPRLMLALLIYSYANGLFSSRRIERASHRDIGVRFVAAFLTPTTTRSRRSGAPTRRRSRRPSCRSCWWRARVACCVSARCRSTAARSTPMPRRSARWLRHATDTDVIDAAGANVLTNVAALVQKWMG